MNMPVDGRTEILLSELRVDLAKGLQNIVLKTISDVFQARGSVMPETIRDKRSDGNNGNLSIYSIVGLKPPYEIGGPNVVAELNVGNVMIAEKGDIAVYAKMPFCDGFNIYTLEEISNGLVQSYTRQVHRYSMNL